MNPPDHPPQIPFTYHTCEETKAACQSAASLLACRMAEISVTGSYLAQWGEGWIWWQGVLYYVDIEKHLVIRFDPSSGEETFWNVGNGGSLAAGYSIPFPPFLSASFAETRFFTPTFFTELG